MRRVWTEAMEEGLCPNKPPRAPLTGIFVPHDAQLPLLVFLLFPFSGLADQTTVELLDCNVVLTTTASTDTFHHHLLDWSIQTVAHPDS